MTRIDDCLPHSSFWLDEELYTIRSFYNGSAECEREDGTIVYLSGHLKIDEYSPRKFSFASLLP